MGTKVNLLWKNLFSTPNLLILITKGDFYLLGVQTRLLTRCKILDVASFLHCLQIIFSLELPSPTLKRHMDLPVHRFVDYKFIVCLI